MAFPRDADTSHMAACFYHDAPRIISSLTHKALLNKIKLAIRAVDIAIEQDEKTAVDWLYTQTQDNMQDGQNHD